MRFLVTGGAGFIGSALVRLLVRETGDEVLTVDKLTYAGNLANLAEVQDHPRHRFVRADIGDLELMRALLADFRPDVLVHLAAESHVDRSIDGSRAFIETNIVGTHNLLEAARAFWQDGCGRDPGRFRFHHVSTDEVFGSLGEEGLFTETSAYDPRSPYSASKAAADHLVRAWHHTYGLPVVLTNCSNNYGPYHFPEKLIPLVILNALEGKPLPVYGTGANVRDWLHVEDHVRGLRLVATRGRIGESYNIGGSGERRNIDLVRTICRLMDELLPESPHRPHERLITFVADRPGHDQRYAIDAGKIRRELGWRPCWELEAGLRATIRWYIDNRPWWEAIRAGTYRGERLGLGT